MDPSQTLQEILQAFSESYKEGKQYRSELVDNLRDLADWIEKGGFIPTNIEGYTEFRTPVGK